jgi:hypothetical protein
MTNAPPDRPRSCTAAWLGLLVQIVVVGLWLGFQGRLGPRIVPDTPGYENYPWNSLTGILSDMRTPTYPAFLKLASLFGRDHRAVPLLQFLCFCAAVLFFYRAYGKFVGDHWLSFAAASALLYSNILLGYVDTVATDTLAAATGIAVCAALLRLRQAGRILNVSGLAALVLLGCLTRPAYLFLVPLSPLLAAALPTPPEGVARPSRWKFAAGVAAMTILPLVMYCGLRWTVTGQFGLVAFGGYNLVGVSGQFLRTEDAPRLAEDLRPIAQSVLSMRESGALPRSPFEKEPPLHYLRMETGYDITIWSEFVPAAKQHGADSALTTNRNLSRIGKSLVLLHPRDYAIWIMKATRQAVKKLAWDLFDNVAYLGATLLLIAGFVFRSLGLGGFKSDAATSQTLVLWTLGLIVVCYAALSLAIVIPVCPPLGRMTDAAGVFLGCPLFVALACLLRRSANPSTPTC